MGRLPTFAPGTPQHFYQLCLRHNLFSLNGCLVQTNYIANVDKSALSSSHVIQLHPDLSIFSLHKNNVCGCGCLWLSISRLLIFLYFGKLVKLIKFSAPFNPNSPKSRCHGSQEIGKTKVRIKLIETSLFTILNMVVSLHFC